MKKLSLLFGILCFFVLGCDDPLKTERDNLYKEVMAIHDEMMLEITPIRKGKVQLETMIENADQQTDSLRVIQLKIAHDQLQEADDAMFGWMNQFSTPSEELPHNEAIKYLKDQKVKVMEMKKTMKENMEKALPIVE